MKNSRKDGTLVVKINKPYTMSVDGQPVQEHVLICHEINQHCEYIAMDIEQYLKACVLNMSTRNNEQRQVVYDKQAKEDEKKAKNYYENECPSVAEVEENAAMLEMFVSMNTMIRVSQIMEKFVGFVNAGLIKMKNGKSLPYLYWNKLDMRDKLKIMYCYCSFFVNPLQNLAELSKRLENQQDMQGTTGKTGMQSGSVTVQTEESLTGHF